jgi:diguanylate cyclase (GGDEF)-like protein/PAS domain S-box-containing protein
VSQNNELTTMLEMKNKNQHNPDMIRQHVDFLLDNTKNLLNANTVYVMNQVGEVVAGTTYGSTDDTFVGNNYSFRHYFKRAMVGEKSVYAALGKTSGQRGIYFSAPITSDDTIKGALVVKIGLQNIDKLLDQFDNAVMLLTPEQVVFSTNREQYMYKIFNPQNKFIPSKLQLKEQFRNRSVTHLKTVNKQDRIELGDSEYLFESTDLNLQDWKLVLFQPIQGFFYTQLGRDLFLLVLATILVLGIIILMLLVNRFHKRKLEKKLRKFSKVVEQSPISVVITDLEGDIEYINHAFERVSGYTRDEIIGENPRILKTGEHDQEYYEELWSTITAGEMWQGEFYNQKKNGDCYWEKAKITSLLDSSGQPESFIAFKEDITEEKELRKELEFFAEMDKLTKVYNRRAGYDILEDIITKADQELTYFAISFIDINNLKEVNDAYGHKTGDELITNVVEIIKQTIRESDYIFRFGGDEFLLVFNYSQKEEVEKIMERIQDKLKEIKQTQNYKYHMSISYGIECYGPNKKIALDELISRADDKMFQYKQEYKENNNLPQR